MDTSTLIQVVLMGVLVIITGTYAWRTHVISKATEKQAEATKELVETAKKEAEIFRARSAKDYVKELIEAVIYPSLDGCTKAKRQLDTNNFAGVYFAGRYNTGWSQVFGLPSELDEEEAKVLSIGTSRGREVFSYPEPALRILSGGFDDTLMPGFESEHQEIADNMAKFDSSLPRLDKLVRSLVVEVKKLIAPYVDKTMGKGLSIFDSELDKGRFVSHLTEICFNHLLMTKEFGVFLRDFKHEPAKKFWEANKKDLLSLLDKEYIRERATNIRHLSGELSGEINKIIDSLESLVKKCRGKYYFAQKDLEDFFIWQMRRKFAQRAAESEPPP